MKRWIAYFGSLVTLLALTSFDLDFRKNSEARIPESLRVSNPLPVVYPKDSLSDSFVNARPPFIGSCYIGFREALAFSESSGNYFITNSYGYLGKYQFGIGTLQLIGIYNAAHFLSTPQLQENAFRANLSRNKWILRREISRYVGKSINGVKITESGLLAAAHLAGAGNVKKYLYSGGSEESVDAYGTSITRYLTKFRGFDTSGILAKRRPKIL